MLASAIFPASLENSSESRCFGCSSLLLFLLCSHYSTEETKQRTKTKASGYCGSRHKITVRINIDVAAVKGKVLIAIADGTTTALSVVEGNGAPRKF